MRTSGRVVAAGAGAADRSPGPAASSDVGFSPGTRVIDTPDVLVEQWVAAELGNSSYLVVDRASGATAVIDPVRDIDHYLEVTSANGRTLVASLDTHVHNDYLSGGPDLRAATGAQFAVPAGGDVTGSDRELSDGDDLAVGALRLRAIHSPGHTPEHLSYLLLDAAGAPLALFSGGALMVGTMARPDLLGPSRLYELSRSGREALRERLLTLPDELTVLPTHGGGSFCGAASSSDRQTTIGREKRENPLATAPDFASFLAVHAKQGRYPAYYEQMAPLNRAAESHPVAVAPVRLSVTDVDAAMASGATVVDCRPHANFDAAHVPDSLAVPVDGPFSAWVGWVVDITTPVVLVAASDVDAVEATRQLVRVGFTSPGWVAIDDWRAAGRAVATARRCSMAELAVHILDGDRLTVVDVRQDNEWAAGHLPGAVHALAPDIDAVSTTLDRSAPVAVHCATGYRAALGVSMLLQRGFTDVWHVTEGVDAWTALGHPLVTSA